MLAVSMKLLFQARQKVKIDHFWPKMTNFVPQMTQNFPFFLAPARKSGSSREKVAFWGHFGDKIDHFRSKMVDFDLLACLEK
jgi:hypothetical protein